MKKRLLLITSLILISALLSGCNIKFIEKVKTETTESSENFGELNISETEDISEKTTEESLSDNNISTQKESSETESTENTNNGTFIYSNINFIADNTNKTMYCSEDCIAKRNPAVDATEYANLVKGDFVTLKAISENGEWAMVSILGGPASFIKMKYLTDEYVQGEKILTSLTSSQQSTTSSESSESTSTESTTKQEDSSQQTSETSEEEIEDNYGGIPYPSNASATSFNMGIEFADVNIGLTVRNNNIQISNGPDRVSNSTGYSSIGTLNKGDYVTCTGIGRNGYVRISINGSIGFVDSINVE